jgi:hypothetical protein
MNRITHFKGHFKDHKKISLDEISKYFDSQGKTNEKSVRSLLSKWIAEGILSRIKKGVYELADDKNKEPYKPLADKVEKKVARLFEEQYPELKYSVWNTGSLNRLMVHQHFSSFYLFEIEADVQDSVFYLFKEHKINVFMADDESILQRYMYDTKEPIVLKKLVSRSPLTRRDKISHPTLEKILVDIFIDQSLFNFAQGVELSNIYNKVFDSYVINITKLLGYADRRKAKDGIRNFIRDNVTNLGIKSLL